MISATDYKTLVCKLAAAENAIQWSADSLLLMADTLNDTETDNDNRAIVDVPLSDAIRAHEDQIEKPLPLIIAATRALQQHVTTHYGSVTSFLTDHNITVPAVFAALSASVGYTIPSGSIVESCT